LIERSSPNLDDLAIYAEAHYASRSARGALTRLREEFAHRLQRLIINRQFRMNLGYAGDFDHPKTYQEKIQYRKLYGNHAFYAFVADKLRAREYVGAKVGAQHLIPLLGAYDRIQASDFDLLPQQFVVKANHGCKWNRIVLDKSQLDVVDTVRRFNRLCRRRFGWERGERHYNFIQPKILIEQLLLDDSGGLPWDYHFFCFRSAGSFDYYYAIESPMGEAGAVFTKDGEILFVVGLSDDELASHARPPNLPQMVNVATALSADFDFVRVDLYRTANQVWFGELTCTPRAGYSNGPNERVQRLRNAMWQLDGDNQRLYAAGGPMR
jgi:hypothetical protein